MDRSVVKLTTLDQQGRDSGMPNATPAERLLMVWPLTLTAWAFKEPNVAQPRLQRNVTRVIRRKNLTIEDLAKPGIVFQIGVEPSRIDILTAISGVDFDHAWQNRLSIELDGIKLCVIGRADLIVNKRAAGRPKDIADAETLEPGGL